MNHVLPDFLEGLVHEGYVCTHTRGTQESDLVDVSRFQG